ncbi:class I adenylate-forming enzyme family protein [Bradyrhizobium sp. 31Argb]|uniref:class I adenylate-forming enzyme family protein n=1 Tax=Bradyrhizobium sp. 31Argb TaxID=3141247 RepID=UPI0037496FB6
MTTVSNLGKIIDPAADRNRLAFIGIDAKLAETRCTFGELDDLADAVARGLHKRGYSQGDRIAILAANSVEFIAVVLGIMRAGLVAVPINYRFPKELIDYVANDSNARLLFCDEQRLALVPQGIAHSLLSRDGLNSLADLADPGAFEAFAPRADEPALVLYTSGSTGRPKGVVLSHTAHLWVARTRQETEPLADERVLIAAPLYHMNALALSFLALASHATTVLLWQFSAVPYIRAIDRYRCTWLTAVPPMIAMMLRERDALASADLSSVRVIRMGSAPVSKSLLEQVHRMLPNARVMNAYGTTEAGPIVFAGHPDGRPMPPLTLGYAHPKVKLRLRDESGQESKEGVLEIKSPALMNRYHNRPELGTVFTPDGYYVTGDVFRLDDDGFYAFVGRRDDMFVCGGENIYPGEVEAMLERHPAVAQACVVPVDDDIKGQKPVAFVALRAHASATEDEIKKFALEHAAAFQHPRRIWFVDSMPLASTQKIDRSLLKSEAAARVRG